MKKKILNSRFFFFCEEVDPIMNKGDLNLSEQKAKLIK